jgi:hypothetical protein
MSDDSNSSGFSSTPLSVRTDQAIGTRDLDKLGTRAFAEQVANVLLNWTQADCFVLALYGKWGQGKSSIKNMTLEVLSEELVAKLNPLAPYPIHFNPWVTNFSSMSDYFFVEIVAQLKVSSAPGYEKILQEIVKYSGLTQSDASDKSTSKFLSKKNLCDFLELERKKILVVVDDIDRLDKVEIRELFRFIKSTVDLPFFTFLLLCDRDVVTEALEADFNYDGGHFLHKFVQVGLDIPKLDTEVLLKYALDNFASELRTLSLKVSAESLQSTMKLVHHYIVDLRSIHRLLNSFSFQLRLHLNQGVLNINYLDLLVLEVFREFDPRIFELIFRNINLLSTNSFMLSLKPDDLKNQAKHLWSVIQEVAAGKKTELRHIFLFLFPGFMQLAGERTKLLSEESMVQNLRLCHDRISHRYFCFQIAEGDLSQVQVRQLLESLQDAADFAAKLSQYSLSGKLRSAVGYLADYGEQVRFPSAAALESLFRAVECDSTDADEGQMSWAVQFVCSSFLRSEKSMKSKSQYLKTAIKQAGALELCIRFIERSSESKSFLTQEHIVELKNWYRRHIQEQTVGNLHLRPRLALLLNYWIIYGGELQDVQEYVRKLVSKIRTCLAFLGGFRSTVYGTDSTYQRIDLQTITKYVEISVVAKKLFKAEKLIELTPNENDVLMTFRASLQKRNGFFE